MKNYFLLILFVCLFSVGVKAQERLSFVKNSCPIINVAVQKIEDEVLRITLRGQKPCSKLDVLVYLYDQNNDTKIDWLIFVDLVKDKSYTLLRGTVLYGKLNQDKMVGEVSVTGWSEDKFYLVYGNISYALRKIDSVRINEVYFSKELKDFFEAGDVINKNYKPGASYSGSEILLSFAYEVKNSGELFSEKVKSTTRGVGKIDKPQKGGDVIKRKKQVNKRIRQTKKKL